MNLNTDDYQGITAPEHWYSSVEEFYRKEYFQRKIFVL